MSLIHDTHPPPAHVAQVFLTLLQVPPLFSIMTKMLWEQRAREEERDALYYSMYEKQ